MSYFRYMKHCLLVITFILGACGPSIETSTTNPTIPSPMPTYTPPVQPNTAYIDPLFNVEYGLFIQEANVNKVLIEPFRVNNIVIKLEDITKEAPLGYRIIGLCYNYYLNADKTYSFLVKIDKSFYETADEYTKRSLIFHELGHCLLNRKHLDGSDDFGFPLSLMNTLIVSGNIFLRKERFYLDELYTKLDDMNLPALFSTERIDN